MLRQAPLVYSTIRAVPVLVGDSHRRHHLEPAMLGRALPSTPPSREATPARAAVSVSGHYEDSGSDQPPRRSAAGIDSVIRVESGRLEAIEFVQICRAIGISRTRRTRQHFAETPGPAAVLVSICCCNRNRPTPRWVFGYGSILTPARRARPWKPSARRAPDSVETVICGANAAAARAHPASPARVHR